MGHFKVNIPNIFSGSWTSPCSMSEIGAPVYGVMHQNVSIVDSIDHNECYWLLMCCATCMCDPVQTVLEAMVMVRVEISIEVIGFELRAWISFERLGLELKVQDWGWDQNYDSEVWVDDWAATEANANDSTRSSRNIRVQNCEQLHPHLLC